ncbi:hypothetical protein ACVIJ6_000485 [Bradyrhizobium sp. USDA 4369]
MVAFSRLLKEFVFRIRIQSKRFRLKAFEGFQQPGWRRLSVTGAHHAKGVVPSKSGNAPALAHAGPGPILRGGFGWAGWSGHRASNCSPGLWVPGRRRYGTDAPLRLVRDDGGGLDWPHRHPCAVLIGHRRPRINGVVPGKPANAPALADADSGPYSAAGVAGRDRSTIVPRTSPRDYESPDRARVARLIFSRPMHGGGCGFEIHEQNARQPETPRFKLTNRYE